MAHNFGPPANLYLFSFFFPLIYGYNQATTMLPIIFKVIANDAIGNTHDPLVPLVCVDPSYANFTLCLASLVGLGRSHHWDRHRVDMVFARLLRMPLLWVLVLSASSSSCVYRW